MLDLTAKEDVGIGTSHLGARQKQAVAGLSGSPGTPERTPGSPGDSSRSLRVGRVLPAELLTDRGLRNKFSSQRLGGFIWIL